jgi:hypothetical protein
MSTSAINNFSNSYLDTTLPSSKTSKASANAGGLSTFAQLLSSSTSSTTAGGSSSTNSPTQMLNQLMASFKTNGIQNEGSSVDPMSIG